MTPPDTAVPARERWRWGLATRVTAVVVGSLVPLILVLALSYTQAANQRRAAEIDNAAVIGQTAAAVVEGFARDIEGTALAAALALGRESPITQAGAGPYVDALAREYPVLRAIFVTDLSGQVVAAQHAEGVGADLSTRPYVAALRGGAEFVWTPGLVGSQSGEVTVAFGRVVRNPAGAPVGYLILAYYPPALVQRLAIAPPADADIAFYDRNGLLLYSTKRPDLTIGRRDASAAPSLAMARAGQVVRLDGPSQLFGGEPRFGTLVPVPRIGWVVGFTRPLAPLEQQLRAQLLQQLVGVTLVMLVVAIVVALLARRLLQPVTVLARVADAIARGERPRVPRLEADPDVTRLAAGMAAMAQAVAEREDALRQQSARLVTLAEASRAFAEAGLDAPSVLDAVTRSVARVLGDGCAISLLSADGQTLSLGAIHHPDPEALALARSLVDRPQRVSEGPGARLILAGQPVFIPEMTPEILDAMVDPRNRVYSERFGLHSLAAVPLRVRERVVGALTVWRDAPGRSYTSDDLQLLEDIGARAALALENAQLFARQEEARAAAERATERTRRLQEITGQLSRSLESEEVLRLVASAAAELLDAPVGAVFLLGGPDEDFELVAAHGVESTVAERLRLPRHASLAGRAIDERRTLVADDVRLTPGTALPQLLTGQTAGSEMAAPILSGEEGLGVVKVFSPTLQRFASGDAELLTALAAAAAVALTNARLYRELRDAVQARDEFLSVAAHELKTPVTALKGSSQLMARAQERGQLAPERVQRLTAMMAGASDRLAALVDDLLDVSRIQSGQLALRPSEVDLAALVRRIAANRAETLDGTHRIETSAPPQLVLEGDPDRLAQVLDNLVDNAIKYSPMGGVVDVRLDLVDGHARLSVGDHGIGLPQGAAHSIFEPFGRAANATERALPGMGLGLYICKNIVERHGGRIWAESAGEDQGTVVSVELPVAYRGSSPGPSGEPVDGCGFEEPPRPQDGSGEVLGNG